MLKGVILLTQGQRKQDALQKAKDHMKKYQDIAWDWYVVGGRLTSFLCARMAEYLEKAEAIHSEHKKRNQGCLSPIFVKKNHFLYQNLWEEMGLSGSNPYADEKGDYDILPLEDCITIVKEWSQFPVLSQEKKQQFSFESHVYNIDEEDFAIPANIKEWWAIMVDMHF